MTNDKGIPFSPDRSPIGWPTYECLMKPVWLEIAAFSVFFCFFFKCILFFSLSLKVKGRLAWNKVCSLEPTKLQDTTRSHV